MIAVDTNILVYAHRNDSEWHQRALSRMVELVAGNLSWCIPWPCIHEFISIITHSGIYKPPTPLNEALAALAMWQAGDNLFLLAESPGYFEKLRVIAQAARISGPRIHDARIAALCLHHGVRELWSADRDFSAFPQLKVRNPLVKK